LESLQYRNRYGTATVTRLQLLTPPTTTTTTTIATYSTAALATTADDAAAAAITVAIPGELDVEPPPVLPHPETHTQRTPKIHLELRANTFASIRPAS